MFIHIFLINYNGIFLQCIYYKIMIRILNTTRYDMHKTEI